MTPAQHHDALANGLTAQDIDDQEAEDEAFQRIQNQARAAALPVLAGAETSCPKCGLRWPVPCQQTLCIERHGECIKCRFVPSGPTTVHGSASGTVQELEQL